MLKHIFRKVFLIIPTFIGISLLAFGIIRFAPGDPVTMLSGERGLTEAQRAVFEAKLGLDQPLIMQYFDFVGNAIQGDLGTSLVTKQPVFQEFLSLFPATLELGFFALLFAILVGIPAGIIAALKRNTMTDYSIMGGALVGYSMPIFWWGLLLILFFSLYLDWTPVRGRLNFLYDIEAVTGFMLIDTLLVGEDEAWEAFWNALHHLILPAIVLGTIPLAIIARMTRSSMLEVLREDYILAAKAKGLHPFWVTFKHALRNAMIPVITVIGLQVSVLITGAILTETIFSWPGIGNWLVNAISQRDYPVVQGGILIIATLVILVNTGVDLLYAVINPKVRSR